MVNSLIEHLNRLANISSEAAVTHRDRGNEIAASFLEGQVNAYSYAANILAQYEIDRSA